MFCDQGPELVQGELKLQPTNNDLTLAIHLLIYQLIQSKFNILPVLVVITGLQVHI